MSDRCLRPNFFSIRQVNHKNEFQHRSNRLIKDPEDDYEIIRVTDMGCADTVLAIEYAQEAFKTYSRMPPPGAPMASHSQSSPGSVQYAINFIDWYETAIEKALGATIPCCARQQPYLDYPTASGDRGGHNSLGLSTSDGNEKGGNASFLVFADANLEQAAKVLYQTLTGLISSPPTIITQCEQGMRFMDEEAFGSIAFLVPFETEEQAIQMAHESDVGLAAYFYTEVISRMFRVSEALKVGMVGARTELVSTAEQLFGGVHESGLGREGGIAALEECLDIKSVTIGI
ncbi:Aldehyde/histidinol dehydrogenase [Aspergillus pseudotamarii]|uniref:Aldehyde/histidinol dehydrogenase n=1 Tax=Aspergillus pseudotamarii TaxID=132259 RepID=A0A5N6T471_ASPPS|nr:Aldehyde/histidinol dehydrogenase [Aspergillus pseudotamarii]KAE8141092.1 Aldehyde/histidinol dehydrogenase [Aspergillus pseudotamarii]